MAEVFGTGLVGGIGLRRNIFGLGFGEMDRDGLLLSGV